jgi:hypothetical protein
MTTESSSTSAQKPTVEPYPDIDRTVIIGVNIVPLLRLSSHFYSDFNYEEEQIRNHFKTKVHIRQSTVC